MFLGRLGQLTPRLTRQPPRLKQKPKTVEPFYSSTAWRRFVAARKLDRDYFAALARRTNRNERVILDHITERKDGGADLDPANTEWLTMSEHQAKTAKRRGERARGEV